jgi:hypothetical protein
LRVKIYLTCPQVVVLENSWEWEWLWPNIRTSNHGFRITPYLL